MRRSLQVVAGASLLLALATACPTFDRSAAAGAGSADNAPAVKPAEFKNYLESIPGSEVKFDMVAIPGGTFLMGSPDGEPGRNADEGPQHPVALRPFWMGKCEVTWDEYDLYWKKMEEEEGKPKPKKSPSEEAADAVSRPTPPYADETFGHGRENHPVICITHHAAMEYCRWLSLKTGKTYRLPTEAEWEYAARAGTRTAYFFGEDPKPLDDYAWYAPNSEDLTHEVGKKKPNPWGLYDIYGNAAEWCLDTYKKDVYSIFSLDKPALAPVVIPNTDRFPHVARGGSWADKPNRLRSAARRGSDKTWIKRDPQRPQSIWWLTDAEFVGFRIVRPVQEQENLKGIRSLTTRESK
ncbi:MAG TPA: formylglycine-generating enzyme family protein [Gemmataceae bacterium]|nr:formylglycine-generating enzyme family protein [Gemmataceae bacterium]